MKRKNNWDKKQEEILEFDRIKEMWVEMALTEKAKERIRETVLCMSENELTARQRETTEAKEMIEKNGNPPLVSLEGIRECVRSSVRGECLSVSQLEKVENALVAVMRLKDYLHRFRQWGNSLAYYDEGLNCITDVKETIVLQIRNGRVDDNASKELCSYREDIDRKEQNMREKANTVLRAN